MSTINYKECKCAVCGAIDQYQILGSTNAFGSPDLDLRPPEMQRSTMNLWIQVCPKCGYVADHIEDIPKMSKEWFENVEYKTCSGINFKSKLAANLYRKYLIDTYTDDKESAFTAILCCAWECDDTEDLENAKHCRMIAIDLINKIIEEGETDVNFKVVKADLLRRSEQFTKLIEEYQDVTFSDKILNDVIAFQIEKSKEKDSKCYTVQDATK